MVDRMSAQLPDPAPTGDWIADLTAAARRQLVTFSTHPWLVEAVGSLRYLGPQIVLDHLDWGLSVLGRVDAPIGQAGGDRPDQRGGGTLHRVRPARRPANPNPPGSQPHRWLTAAVSAQPAAQAADDLFDRVLAGILHGVLGTR